MSHNSKFLFVNRFYYPDLSATSQILTDVAEGLHDRGATVAILTSRLGYDATGKGLPKTETVKGVDIIRIPTTKFGRGNALGRLFDYLSFYMSCLIFGLKHLKRGDILIVKTDPPLLSVPMSWVARLKKAKSVNWLQDIYPELAAEFGVPLANKPLVKLLTAIRNRAVRASAQTVVISDGMREHVKTWGVDSNKITLIPNFTDDKAIIPLPKEDNPFRKEWGLTPDEFIIGYSGNLGRGHDVDTILDAAELLRDDPKIKFLFIGSGHLYPYLRAEIDRRDLSHFILKPYQPRDKLNFSLCVPDCHWISLRPNLEGLMLPSKLYGIAAAGRPMIMIGKADGDIATVLNEQRCGIPIEPGHSKVLAETLTTLKDDPVAYAEMAINARRFIDESGSQAQALDAWYNMLMELSRSK